MDFKKTWIFVIILAFSLCIYFLNIESSNYLNEKIKKTDFFGPLENKFFDSTERGVAKILIGGEKFDMRNREIFDKLSLGDTLLKHKENFKYYLIKNNDTTVFYQIYKGDEIKG